MWKRISIDSSARMYYALEADLDEANAAIDEIRCSACGAEVVEAENELFKCCSKCGHPVEVDE